MSQRNELQGVGSILRRVLQRVRPHLGRQRRTLTIAFLALFAEAAFTLLEPWPLKYIFDLISGYAPAGGDGIAGTLAANPITLLVVCALALPLITGLRALSAYWNSVGFALVGTRVLTDLRAELYRHLHSLSLRFHDKARGGDLLIRVIGDVGMLRDATVTAVLPLLAHSIVWIGMISVMFWLHWKLTLAALSVAPLFWLLQSQLTRRIHAVARRQRKRESAMAATAAESIAAIRVVQSLSLEDSFERSFSSKNEQGFKEGVQGRRLSARLERSVDVLTAIGTAVAVGYGTFLVLDGELTPGDLFVVIMYLRRSFRPVKKFAKYSARLAKAAAAGERVLEVLEHPAELRDAPGARPAPSFRGGIEFDGVHFAYEPEAPVLEGLSFRLEAGRTLAVVGSIGSGKSTLASLLLRLYDPDRGRVLIDGTDIREYTIESLRRQTSMILQDPVLFAGSIRENIGYGREGASEAEIEAVAQQIGIEEIILGLPDGYDSIVGERGVTLSSGQRQLITICRAAIRGAPILILDEPTASLDGAHVQLVDAALDRLAEKRTTLMITHDLRRAATADWILYLRRGGRIEVGTHAELLQANDAYAAAYRTQHPEAGPSSERTPHAQQR